MRAALAHMDTNVPANLFHLIQRTRSLTNHLRAGLSNDIHRETDKRAN